MSYVSLSQLYDSYHKDGTEEFHLNYPIPFTRPLRGAVCAVRVGTWVDFPERRTEDAGNHLELWWKQRIFGIP